MSHLLSDKYRNEITWNGYRSDIMKSGLQKYIRRGNMEKALYCAGELDLFKEAPERGEIIRTNFIHRLIIIYLEDAPNIAILNKISNLIQSLMDLRSAAALLMENFKRDTQKEEEKVSELVKLLVLSPKGRICSHVRAIFNPAYHTKELLEKYPSIAKYVEEIKSNKEYMVKNNINELDFNCSMFTKYLKAKSVIAAYYGFQIHNSTEKLKEKYHNSSKPVYYIFKKLNETINPFVNTQLISNCEYFYKEQIGQMKEGFLSWLVPLLHHIGLIPYGEIPSIDKYAITDGAAPWDKNRAQEKIEIDDYVEDKHTKKGRNKGILEFALQGAKVTNEATYINPVWKRFYEDSKRFEEGIAILGENYTDNNTFVNESITIKVPINELKVKRKPRIGIIPKKETN
jgi:hypothetical protein